MTEDSKIRLLKLMLYRAAGGTGYDLAIAKLAKESPEFYKKLSNEIQGIKDDIKG